MATWMVVEDEPDIYEVLLLMLEAFGVEGLAFVDGEEAASWIDDVNNGYYHGEIPSVALLDIRLPGSISGLTVGERLRNSPYIPSDLKIILVTAYKLTAEEEVQAMRISGADKLIYKPIPRFTDFQRIVSEL